MFIHYLSDRKSWLAFFLLSLLAADSLMWLDPGIGVEVSSVIYMNFLLLLALSLFVYWRYKKETKFARKLRNLAQEPVVDWIEALPEADFQQDEVTVEVLQQAGRSFSASMNAIRRDHLVQGDYMAAWVHEAKAPLTAMKLVVDANRDTAAMRKIESEWLRLYLLIDQQLYISRLPALESDYVLEETPLKTIVSGEARELMSWCREKNLAIETDGLDRMVVTDKKWSRFILRQVLSNAVKYSPEGAMIEIAARVDEAGHTVLSITDEGPGIEVHELPRIFDKGYTGGTGRLHNAATGLGLYLAKTVADKIGVGLAARSQKGEGTTIDLVFSHENDFDAIRK